MTSKSYYILLEILNIHALMHNILLLYHNDSTETRHAFTVLFNNAVLTSGGQLRPRSSQIVSLLLRTVAVYIISQR